MQFQKAKFEKVTSVTYVLMAFVGMKGNMPMRNGIYANEVARLILKLSIYCTRKIQFSKLSGVMWPG